MNWKKDLCGFVLNIDFVIAGAGFIFLVGVTFAGVVMRYVFKAPFSWLEEVQLMCFIWMAFMGGCMVFRQGNHICIDILVDTFPPKVARFIEWVIALINAGALIYLCLKGIQYVLQMHISSRMTSILGIPYAVIYSILPVGCVLMIANQMVYLLRKGEI